MPKMNAAAWAFFLTFLGCVVSVAVAWGQSTNQLVMVNERVENLRVRANNMDGRLRNTEETLPAILARLQDIKEREDDISHKLDHIR